MKMMFCTFGHLPPRDENGTEYEAEHGEKHRDRANHPVTAHLMNNWTSYIIISKGSCQKKTFFLGYLSQMWVGGVADSQTRSKPLKTPPNCPENCLFRPKFHLSFSQISKNPGVGKQIWERSPPKKVFFTPSLIEIIHNRLKFGK